VATKAIETQRDACAGELNASRRAEFEAKQDNVRLRLENATLAAATTPTGAPPWLRVGMGYVAGGTSVVGVACAVRDDCPTSTAVVLLVGSTATAVFALLLPDRWFREARGPRS
jgi:hypothetical protein